MTTTIRSRYEYIDITKGIGILLVVWAHILLIGWSHELIYAFHMPLFFFVSGMLFRPQRYDSFKQFVVVRAKRLLVPYAIYSVATWCVWAGFRYLRGDSVDSYVMPLLQTVIAQGSGEFMVHNSALWFIPCLFAVEIIYFFVCKSGEVWSVVASVVIAGISYLLSRVFGDSYMFLLPWNLDAAFYALPFYSVANVMWRHLSHEQFLSGIRKNLPASGLVIVVLGLLLCYLAFNFHECSMGSSSYQCAIGIFFVRAFVGCVWLLIICGLLTCIPAPSFLTNPLSWCGKNSLDIMCLHIPIKGVAVILVDKFLHPTVDVQDSASLSAIAFAISMLVCIPIIILINKYIRHQ